MRHVDPSRRTDHPPVGPGESSENPLHSGQTDTIIKVMDLGAKFFVGTSGYSFPDWVGTFYPPGTRAKDMFAYYVRHFRTVEINYTFYRIPSAATLEAMARQTPPEFTFWVKAHQEFTHEHELKAAKAFLEALGPLQARGQLAGVLLQYPQSFHRTVANRRALQGALEAFESVPAAVEFRHGSWDHPATFAACASAGLRWSCPTCRTSGRSSGRGPCSRAGQDTCGCIRVRAPSGTSGWKSDTTTVTATRNFEGCAIRGVSWPLRRRGSSSSSTTAATARPPRTPGDSWRLPAVDRRTWRRLRALSGRSAGVV